jgi:molybdopterin converting factor small subunit
MKITAEFHGILAEWVGTRSASFDLPAGATYSDLMEEIGLRYRRNMPDQLWNKENKMFKKVQAQREGRVLASADTPLLEGEEIQFLLMIAGG